MAQKATVLDLEKYLDQEVSVRFQGGREGRSGWCPDDLAWQFGGS